MALGDLSKKYESNGNPARVSSGRGDLGGISYGCYQFASNQGIPQAFVEWARCQPEPLGNYGKVLLEAGPVNSQNFIDKWKELGIVDPFGFASLQHEYTKCVYFDAGNQNLIDHLYLDVTTHSEALQQVLWSHAVHYSAYYMPELFQAALDLSGQDINAICDHDFIYYIYQYLINDGEQAYQLDNGTWHSPDDWFNGSRDVIDGLLSRCYNEREDALAML